MYPTRMIADVLAMNIVRHFSLCASLALALGTAFHDAGAQATNSQSRIPDALKPWESWATWSDDALRLSPTVYSDPRKPIAFWPSELRISAADTGAAFRQTVTVYSDSWMPLPGDATRWPTDVKVNGQPAAVLAQDKRPAIRLTPGTREITGTIPWKSMPQNIQLPREVGIIALDVDGAKVETPLWDASGKLWLKRDASPEEAAGPDSMTVNLYAVLEDGIPLWLRLRAELIVSGKSREEDLGTLLPEGWKISTVNCPIPVAVEENGQAKAQVRAGKWTINLSAFRIDDARELRFAPQAQPAADSMLLGFRAKPDFRVLELTGGAPVDVTMTTFPDDWRDVPVYRWALDDQLKLDERLRGMGQKAPEGLHISRSLWLDEDGRAFTFRDSIKGAMQRIWRLDAAPGQELGSVRANGEGQLITRNPESGAPGVEVRQRNITLEATGRMQAKPSLSATGWQTDADSLDVTLNLPPGWRLFALFGADWVQGDWLTAWSLLDIFVVLIFSLAVMKLWGFGPALLAFVALALSYREPGAPQLLWLALLAPVAILRFVPEGKLRTVVSIWKGATVLAVVFAVVPFLSAQIQQAIYPQLERVPNAWGSASGRAAKALEEPQSVAAPAAAPLEEMEDKAGEAKGSLAYSKTIPSYTAGRGRGPAQQQALNSNLAQFANARIQTGPGVPEWTWRASRFGWNGPVTAAQTFRPVLIPAILERLLTVLRIATVIALLALLLGRRMPRIPSAGVAAIAFAALLLPASARAQFPDAAMIGTLRERTLEKTNLPPQTAEIPLVSLKLDDRKITVDADVHTASLAAVPMPGRLPAWSPLTVTVDGKPGAALRRDDGYLWVALTPGVHNVRIEGMIGEASEWEWTFLLKPRRVRIEAPGWNTGGVNPDGVPEQQVFFSKQQKSTDTTAAYDRQDFQTLAVVEREIEIGLVRQVRTTVRRLTPTGKAIALNIPLLAGEKVLSGNVPLKNGAAEVRIAAGQEATSWQSELEDTAAIALATRENDSWVEQWRLLASPVWNFRLGGLAPVFAEDTGDLVPVWHPWPGEKASIDISGMEAVPGATVTVQRVKHSESLGDRQLNGALALSLTSSLGGDFQVGLPSAAQVTSLTLGGQEIPVRLDNGRIVVPLRTGAQELSVAWKTAAKLGARTQVEAIRLAVDSANVETEVTVPSNRWVLWAHGPQRGPAVRFWIVLAFSLLAAAVLGRIKSSPLRTGEWMLLGIGLTQVSLPEALIVIAWLFLLAWRGRDGFQKFQNTSFNLLQILIMGATLVALSILVHAVGAGLLGSPEMFIEGNGSSGGLLRWYLARTGEELPRPWILSVSIWWYRLAMLLWALWLATATLRWLVRGWSAFTSGGALRPMRTGSTKTPPPLQQP